MIKCSWLKKPKLNFLITKSFCIHELYSIVQLLDWNARAHLNRTWHAQVNRTKFDRIKTLRLHAITALGWHEKTETIIKLHCCGWVSVHNLYVFLFCFFVESVTFWKICCSAKKWNELSTSLGFYFCTFNSLCFCSQKSEHKHLRHDRTISMKRVLFSCGLLQLLVFRNLHTKWNVQQRWICKSFIPTDWIEQNRARSKTSLNYLFSISFTTYAAHWPTVAR